MTNYVKELHQKGLISPSVESMSDRMHYLTIMGSVAYGVSNKTSDMDLYGWYIPPKEIVFPHTAGEVLGFGKLKHPHKWTGELNYQHHHIKEADSEKEYDLNIYGIIDYFQLAMENNPNMLNSLFTPESCVVYMTKIGKMVKDKRKIFLHRGSFHTYKGMTYSQLKLLQRSNYEGKKKIAKEQYGYDPKSAYQIVLHLNLVEQILIEGDLDLQRNREQLKSIRAGDWSEEQVVDYAQKKIPELETLYSKCTLPWGPEHDGLQDRVKQLLFECLEEEYGSLSKAVGLANPDAALLALKEINSIVKKLV